MPPPDPERPGPLASPEDSPAARVAAALARELARRGRTGVYTASTQKFAVISVTTGLTVWTDGRRLWTTQRGQRRAWPAADIARAAADLAAMAAAPEAPG